MKGCRPLTSEEVSVVEGAFGGTYPLRDRCLFVLGTRTGFRIGELLAIELGDVVGADGRAADWLAVERRHMKGKREGRTVRLSPASREAIDAWVGALRAMGITDPRTALFPGFVNGVASGRLGARRARVILSGAYDRAGLTGKLSTHSMRKTCAARAYERFGDIVKVQKVLGHASISSTQSYLSFADREVEAFFLED